MKRIMAVLLSLGLCFGSAMTVMATETEDVMPAVQAEEVAEPEAQPEVVAELIDPGTTATFTMTYHFGTGSYPDAYTEEFSYKMGEKTVPSTPFTPGDSGATYFYNYIGGDFFGDGRGFYNTSYSQLGHNGKFYTCNADLTGTSCVATYVDHTGATVTQNFGAGYGGLWNFDTYGDVNFDVYWIEDLSGSVGVAADEISTAAGSVNGQDVTFTVIDNHPFSGSVGVQYNAINTFGLMCTERRETISTPNSADASEWDAYYTAVYGGAIKEYCGVDVPKITQFVGSMSIMAPIGLDVSSGTTITFRAPGVQANDKLVLTQILADGSMRVIPAVGGDGTVTATFETMSWMNSIEVYLTERTYSSGGSSSFTTTGKVNGQDVVFHVSSNPYASANDVQSAKLDELFDKIDRAAENSGIDWNQDMTEEQITAANTALYAGVIAEYAGINVSRVYNAGFYDIQNTSGADISSGATIAFDAWDVNAGDTVIVLHLKADGTWEVIPATAGDGVITGTFTSLSPVYYFKVDMAAASGEHYHNFGTLVVEPTATTWGYTTYYCACGYEYHDDYVAPLNSAAQKVTSPETAENALPFVMAVAAVAAIGGAGFIARRKYTA